MDKLAAALIKFVAASYALMLGLGILHAQVLAAVHPVGFTVCMALDATLGTVLWIESRPSGEM